jgi:hypothetical protein
MRELQHAEGGDLPSVRSVWNNDGVLVITRRSLLAGLLSTAAAVPARSAFNCGGYVGGMDLGSGDMTATVLTDGTSWLHYTPDQICGQFNEAMEEMLRADAEAFRLMRKMLLREGAHDVHEEETSGPPPPDPRPGDGDGHDGLPQLRRGEPRPANKSRGRHHHATQGVQLAELCSPLSHERGSPG